MFVKTHREVLICCYSAAHRSSTVIGCVHKSPLHSLVRFKSPSNVL